MKQLYIIFLYLLAMSAPTAHAYVPTTWISGAPNNLHTPLCVASVHKEQNIHAAWRGAVLLNPFMLAQWSEYSYEQCEAFGIALQGHLQMNKVLKGLYSQVYAAALVNHESTADQVAQPARANNLASLADTHVLIGWNGVHNKRIRCSGYAFGVLPATKHSLFDPSKKIFWVGLDDHFAWGFGLDASARLRGTPRHHIDLLIDTDVTMLASRKELAWSNTNGIYQPYQIQLDSNQLYKIRSALAYQYKYFISDVGFQCFYMSKLRYSTTFDPAIKNTLTAATHWQSLFCNIGTAVKMRAIPAYITAGGQVTASNHTKDAWSVNVKFGMSF